MSAEAKAVTYLILHTASGSTRKVIHIGHERDGEQVPRCNSHYTSQNDLDTQRRFRPAEGEELEYRVCQRCVNWRGWVW
jgi:hypothetical protein